MSKIKLLFAVTSLCSFSAVAGEADIQLPSLDQVSFFHGAVTSRAILFFGLLRVRRRRGVWDLGIRPHPRVAGPPLNARGLAHHLGNVQNLSVAAGEISRRAVGAHRGMHDLLFHRAATQTVQPGAGYPGLFHFRHPRQLRRGVVRHPHQHHCQLARRRLPRCAATR